MKPQYGRDLTTGSIPRHLVLFSLPMLVGNIIQTAYSLVNAIWVGKGLGKTDLAAVTVTFPVMFLLMAMAFGVSMGSGILAAQFAGARDHVRLRRLVNTSGLAMIVISVVVLVAGELATTWILRIVATPADVYPLARGYLRLMLLTMPFSFWAFLLAALLRGVGDSKTPLYFQAGALALTALLDPLLIFGWLGFPRMGLNGAAVASVTSQALGIVALIVHMRRRNQALVPSLRLNDADAPMAWLVLKIGMPSVVQQALVSMGMVVVTGLVNGFGENATAAFGAAMRIDQIAFLPALTFGMSVATVAGQNIGAQAYDRVRQVFRSGLMISGGTTLVMAAVVVVGAPWLLRMFLNDPEVLRIGVRYLRIMGIAYVCFAVMFVSNGIINGAGHTVITTFITLLSVWVARLPLATYLVHRWHRVEGIWVAMAASSVVFMAVSLAYYRSGRWKRVVIKPTSAAPVPGGEFE